MFMFAADLVLLAFSAQASTEVPKFGVQTQLVYIDAVVTDKRGRTVAGLGMQDFALYEDGKLVPIVALSSPGRSPGAAEEEAARVAETRPTPVPADRSEPMTFVVYVDNANLTFAGRRRLLAGVRAFLAPLLATGRARALVLSGDGETLARSSLTADPQEIAMALSKAEAGAAGGQQMVSDERTTIDVLKGLIETFGACHEILPMLQGAVRTHAEARRHHLDRTLARLGEAVAALAALPGQKALLYLNDGVDLRPAVHLFHQIGDICPTARQRDFSQLLAPMTEYDLSAPLRQLTANANAARVTVYPLDGGGLRTHSLADVSYAERRYTPSTQTDAVREANLRAGQWMLADQTGGSPVFDANDPSRDLGRLAQAIEGGYSLAFAPEHEPDARSHTIRVELRRKGLKVRHRLSYFHGGPTEAVLGRILAALFYGIEDDTLGVETTGVWSGPEASGRRPASVRIAVPLSGLAVATSIGDDRAHLRIVLAVRKHGGAKSDRGLDVREKSVAVPLPASSSSPAPSRQEFVVEVLLSQGDTEIGVGVQDLGSGRASFRRLRLEP